jgi:hypothetical protein
VTINSFNGEDGAGVVVVMNTGGIVTVVGNVTAGGFGGIVGTYG